MADVTATIRHMARKRKPAGDGGGGKPRPGFAVFARVKADIGDALQAFIDAQRFPPTLANVVETALVEFLKREGFYPPKKGGAG
jgi:hypothetical protein